VEAVWSTGIIVQARNVLADGATIIFLVKTAARYLHSAYYLCFKRTCSIFACLHIVRNVLHWDVAPPLQTIGKR
jgi:hypothetical protein